MRKKHQINEVDSQKENQSINSEQKESNEEKRGYRRGMRDGIIFCLVLVLVFGLGRYVAITGTLPKVMKTKSETLLDADTVKKVNTIAATVRENYYKDVTVEEQREYLMKGLLSNLDAYSAYFSKEELESYMSSNYEGEFYGIGAAMSQDKTTKECIVQGVEKESPAEEAGIEKGDIIISANGYKAITMTLEEFVSNIKGEEGTKVTLEIKKAKTGKVVTLEIERKAIAMRSVASDMINNNVGYIYIASFRKNTTDQFKEELKSLQDKGMKYLIIDLRDNGGGVVSAATDCLDQLLPEGLLVYTESRSGKRKDYKSTDKTSLDIPIAILVNDQTASSSEIFAGAMQDRKAATIIGTTTFGKGIVQNTFKFTDGSGMKMTTDRYYTPNGVCIDGEGIKPDVVLEYENLGGENGEYSYENDNQIQAAIALWK